MAMLHEGDDSLWGVIDDCTELVPDMAYVVGTPSHGGVMILANSEIGKELSDAAWEIGQPSGKWLCFEEDLDYTIAYRELYRLGCLDQMPIEYQRAIEEKPDSWFGSDELIAKWYPGYASEHGLA